MLGFNQYKQVKFITKEYEKLIEAQGWAVKWERASHCTCYDDALGAPDYKCLTCKGRGYVYSKPDDVQIKGIRAKVINNNTIKICDNPSEVSRVYNLKTGIEYTVTSINNNVITVSPASLLSHQGIYVDYNYSIAKTKTETLKVQPMNLDQIIVQNKYIQSIISIHNDTTNENLNYDYFTDDMVKLSTEVNANDIITIIYTYIQAIKMILTDAKEQRTFRPTGEFIEGDIMVTFMHYYDIGTRDKLTIIDNDVSTRYNDLLVKGSNDYLKLDHVIKIIEIRDKDKVYEENIDFKFTGSKGILWLDSGDAPEEGSKYSVLYTARREYIIWGEMWQERHHGGILLPRRLMARKLEKINQSLDASFEDDI